MSAQDSVACKFLQLYFGICILLPIRVQSLSFLRTPGISPIKFYCFGSRFTICLHFCLRFLGSRFIWISLKFRLPIFALQNPSLGCLVTEASSCLQGKFSGNKALVKLVLATLATAVLFYFYGLHKKTHTFVPVSWERLPHNG